MIKKIANYLRDLRDLGQMEISLARGAAMMNNRNIDLKNPISWEFSGFSQNGEDGIIDILTKNLINPNRYFIEIGSADGLQNNSSWLAVAEQYSGLMIDGNARLIERANRLIPYQSTGIECIQMFVNIKNVAQVKQRSLRNDPDVFSLDIDGVDYYIAKAVMETGLRPKIFVVEYNSAYGPENSLTIPYKHDFSFRKEHPSGLYYGVAISAWKKLFGKFGYRFITVDSKGINAFFVDDSAFKDTFLKSIDGKSFVENVQQLRQHGGNFSSQFNLIKELAFTEV